MKQLKKITLKDASLNDSEMKLIRGGEATYNCMRYKDNPDGSKTVFTFSTDSEGVANSWANFWNSPGLEWKAACVESGNSYLHYA